MIRNEFARLSSKSSLAPMTGIDALMQYLKLTDRKGKRYILHNIIYFEIISFIKLYRSDSDFSYKREIQENTSQ